MSFKMGNLGPTPGPVVIDRNDAADLNSVNANGVVFPTPALTLKEDPTNGKVMGVLSHGFDASVFSTDANGYFKVVPA